LTDDGDLLDPADLVHGCSSLLLRLVPYDDSHVSQSLLRSLSLGLDGVHDGLSSAGCRVRVTPARSFFGWATLCSCEGAAARRTGLVGRSEGATITAS